MLAYVFYAVSAILLAYSVYTIVIYAPVIGKKVRGFIQRVPLAHKLVKNYGFRTLFMATDNYAKYFKA